MKNPSRQPDLLGTPQPDLFQAMPQVPDHDTYVSLARTRLRAYLAQARSASRMPWPDRDAEVIEDTYATTAKWLPEPERAEICAALRSEFERLRNSA